ELNNETFKRITISLYRYVNIKNPALFRDVLYTAWSELNIKGRIYLAKEGINAQFSCPEHNFEAFTKSLEDYDYLKDIPLKIAVEDDGKSFIKLTIKVRNRILADGMDDNSYDTSNVGKHLTAAEWNKHMADPNTIVVDVRNHYEHEIGHFKGALCAESDTFKEDLPKIHDKLKGKEDQKILLYCTGGIRCEKTSAFLKHEGFEDVNQLHGGIIDYARQIEAENLENNFIGKNFVFDERRGERISDDIISSCHQCGEPSDEHTNCSYLDCNLLFIQCENCKTKHGDFCSSECHDNSKLSPEEQKALRAQREKEGLQEYSKSLRPKIKRLE
ncbi:MAG: rhodanese-related sulfurtransferase, partial [Vicingaceae bacterium]